MGRYSSVIVFIILTSSAALSSIGSYCYTRDMIVNDLNEAVMQTIAEKREAWTANDTIKAYRRLQGTTGGNMALNYTDATLCRHLSIPQLRETAYMRVRILDKDDRGNGAFGASGSELCSDTVIWSTANQGTSVALRGYARCSTAMVFGMSDQRLPLILCIASMMWAMASVIRMRQRPTDCDATATAIGNLLMSADGNSFSNADGTQVRLTPMQHQLMRMFFRSGSHSLTKTEICEALWPKKEDASETLYTLVKRLRPVIEANSNLCIESDRGRAYQLTVRQMS